MNSSQASNGSGLRNGHGAPATASVPPPETEPALAESGFTFDSMGLKVGDRLQAQLPPSVFADRCFVRLLGYVHGHSLMVSLPKTAEGVRPTLRTEDKLLIRHFSGKSAFAFSSHVMCEYQVPFSQIAYLHIAFPQKIQGTKIRKEPRVRASIVTRVATPATAALRDVNGTITNLSASGAMLTLSRGVAQAGQQIKVNFNLKLHDVDTHLNLKCQVRTIVEDEKPSATPTEFVGLEFQDLQPHDKMLLQSVVYQKMIEEPQSVI